jgi:endonuclease YncB( thermonuclease family)
VIKRSNKAKATVELRPSRIRRDPVRIEAERPRKVRRRSREQDMWLGIAGVSLFAGAIAMATFGLSVISAPDASAGAATAAAQRFGPCEGGPNCVVDGETIRIAGQTVKIAGIETAPLQSAKCPDQEILAARAIETLTGLLNSGKVSVGAEFRDSDGAPRRTVLVDGKDVAAAMISAGVAEAPGNLQGSSCA